MVQKSKGGKKSISALSKKKMKNEMKHHRKTNYKKNIVKKVECCVCMEEISNTSDNTITCGKVHHALCGECKMKCDTCPMCRSHKIKPPISQAVNLPILKINEKEKKTPKKIKIKSFAAPCWNGIYEEIGKDKDKMSIYRSTYGLGKSWYIYRSDSKFKEWILNDRYSPKSNLIIGACWNCKFIGSSMWDISAVGGGWEKVRITISVVDN
jgi:hypothetical protein